MKKPLSVVLLSTLAMSMLLISGCGMFRSHKDWKKAQQESPLEIPPGLDTPATADALVIPPPGANQPTANGARAGAAAPATDAAHTQVQSNAQDIIADSFVISGTLDSTYAAVGHALSKGDFGVVRQRDEEAHSYTLDVVGATDGQRVRRGFFGRMFHRDNYKTVSTSGGSGGETTYPVTVTVGVSGSQGSQVSVEGEHDAVVKVIDGLRQRLGASN